MQLTRFLTTAAVAALLAGAAQAQTPPAAAPAAPATAAAPGAKVTPAGDIVDTVKASGQFTTFLKAAEATNLTGLLKTNKNLTVFAPTDAAFAALPPGELEKLMLPENKAELQKLMIYHIVNAPVTSADFKGATRKAATVAGPSVELSGGDTPKVNDATIVQADIAASNGVIHVVDKVLTPGAASATATGAAASATAPEAAPAQAAPAQAAPAKTAPPKDKLAALAATGVQCQVPENKEMAPSPVPAAKDEARDGPVKDGAVKDEAATPPPPVTEAAPTPADPAPATEATPPPAPTPPMAAPGTDASTAVATTATVAMQPVADTPENRAKYAPLSNAGKRSKTKGN